MDSDNSEVMAARVAFVKSRIQPEIEEVDKDIKHLELLIAIMNGKMNVLTAHRRSLQYFENLAMTRGDFRPQDNILIDDDNDNDDEEEKPTSRLDRMAYVLNKFRKTLRLTTTTPEVTVEHLKGAQYP